MPVLNELGKKYGQQGLVVLAISVDGSRRDYKQFIKKTGYSHLKWGYDSSREIAGSYRVTGVPTTYVLDHEGVIHSVHVGYGSGLKELLRQEIETLLARLPRGRS